MIDNFAEKSQYKKFRQENPQYDEIPDSVLLGAIHRVKYSQLPFEVFKTSFDKVYGNKSTFFGNLGKGLMAGLGDVVSSVGSIVDLIAGSEEPSAITRFGEEIVEDYAPPIDIQKSIADDPGATIGDIDWWAYNLTRLLPFTLSTLIPGGVAFKGASLLGKAVGVGSKALRVVEVGSGALGGGLYESLAEAGNVYTQSIKEGVSKEEAKKRANNVLGENVALNVAINAIQIGKVIRLSKVPLTPDHLKITARKVLSDAGVSTITESAQEWTQQIISNVALGNDPFEGGWESAILGAAAGIFYGGGLEVFTKLGSAGRNEVLESMQKAHEGLQGEVEAPTPPLTPPVEPPKQINLGEAKTITPTGEPLPVLVKEEGTGKITEMPAKPTVSKRAKEFGKTVSEIDDPSLLNDVIVKMENALSKDGKDRELVDLMHAMRETYKDDKEYARWLATAYGDLLSNYIKDYKTRKKADESKPNRITDDAIDVIDEKLKEEIAAQPEEKVVSGVAPPQSIEEFNRKRELIESNPDLNEEQKREALKVLEDSRGFFLMDKLENAFGGEHKELIRAQINLLADALDMTPQKFVSKTISDVIVGGKYKEGDEVDEYLQKEFLLSRKEIAESKFFKAWSADGGILWNEEENLPLVLFHGTAGPLFEDFEHKVMDVKEKGKWYRHVYLTSDMGWHLGSSKSANQRLENTLSAAKEGARILFYYGKMKNPFRMADITYWEMSESVISSLIRFAQNDPGTHPDDGYTIHNRNEWDESSHLRGNKEFIDELTQLRDNWHKTQFAHEVKVREWQHKFGADSKKLTEFRKEYLELELDVFNKLRGIFKKYGYDGITYINRYEDEGNRSYIFFDSSQLIPLFLPEKEKAIKARIQYKEDIYLQKSFLGKVRNLIDYTRAFGKVQVYTDEKTRKLTSIKEAIGNLIDSKNEEEFNKIRSKILEVLKRRLTSVKSTFPSMVIGYDLVKDITWKDIKDFQNAEKDIRGIEVPKSITRYLAAIHDFKDIYGSYFTQDMPLLNTLSKEWEDIIFSKSKEEFEDNRVLLIQNIKRMVEGINELEQKVSDDAELRFGLAEIRGHLDNLLSATRGLFFNNIQEFKPYYQAEKSIQNGIVNGATKLAKDGRAIINLFDNANFSTFTHELFHAIDLAGLLPKESIYYMEEYVEKPYKGWGRDEREKLARAWETYWMEGVAPNTQLKKVFDKIKRIMLKIYNGLKSLIGEEIPSGLRKAFDIMIDKESRLRAADDIKISKERKEVLQGNDEIRGQRIVGSIDNVNIEDVVGKQEALRNVGYHSEVIENPDGTFTVMYFIEKSPKVERAISLQRREIETGDLGVQKTKELGGYYGYTKAERDQFIDLWRAKIKSIKEKEKYYEGETYTSQYRDMATGRVKVGRNIWRVKSREGDKIRLELIGGKLFTDSGGTTVEMTATEDEIRRAGFIKEKVKKPGLPRGSTTAKATEQRRKAVASWRKEYPDEEPTTDDIDNYISKEIADEFREYQEKATPQQTIQSSLTEEDRVLPEGFSVRTPGLPSDYETYMSEKQREKEILESAKSARERGETELAEKLENLVKELKVGNKEAKSMIESDPDTDLPDGTLLRIPQEVRLQHYKDLGLTEEEGNALSDDELEKMLINKYGLLYQMNSPGMTKEQIDQFEKEGKQVSDRTGISKTLEHAPTSWAAAESIRRTRDRIFLFLGMKQALARYQPRLFGKLFYAINDLIRLADEKVNYLLSPDYKKVTHASHSSKTKVAQALIQGTLYIERLPEDSEVIVKRPKKVWLDWDSLDEYAKTHTNEEVNEERRRRKEARRKYNEDLARWVNARASRKQGKVWTSEELRTRFGMNNEEVKMYYTVRNTLDGAVTLAKNAAIAYGMSKEEAERVFSGVGYCPLDRGTGNWALFFPDPDSETGYNYTRFKSYKEAVSARKRLVDSGVIKNDDPQTVVHRASESVRYQPNLIPLDAMIDYIESAGIPANRISDYPDIERLMKEVKKRTYMGRRLIRRGNANLIADADNLFEVIDTFVTRSARRYAKALANVYIESEVRAVPKSSIWAKFAREYVSTAFSIANDPASEERWNKIRRFGFLWYLGWNTSNALLNLTQPALTTIPFLLEKRWGLKASEVASASRNAVQASLAYTFDKKIPKNIVAKYPGLLAAIEEWKSKAVTSPTLAEQLAGIRGGAEEFMHFLGYLQFATEKQNRSFSAIVGYILSQKVLQNAKSNPDLALELSEMMGFNEELMRTVAVRVPYEKRGALFDSLIKNRQQKIIKGELNDPADLQLLAVKFGSRTADTTQFVFGRHTYPNYITSAGWLTSPLKSAFLFRGFINNYVGFILTGLQKGRIRPIQTIVMLAPLLILSGISGLPFADDLKKALYASGIVDVDTELRRIINNPDISDITLKGVPSILWDSVAFDISRRGGAGNLMPEGMASAIGKTLTLQPAVSDYGKMLADIFGGAPLSGASEIVDGIRNIWEGQYSIAAQKLMPLFLTNVWKAGRQSIEGAITEEGNLRVPKEKLGGGIGMIRTAIGFRPAAIAKATDFERAINFLEAARRSKISLFNEKIATALRTNDIELLNDVIMDIIKYNSKVQPGSRYDINAQMANIRRRVFMGRVPWAEMYTSTRSLTPEYLKLHQLYK